MNHVISVFFRRSALTRSECAVYADWSSARPVSGYSSGALSCQLGSSGRVGLVTQLQNFFEIGIWYRKREIANRVIRAYGQALDVCGSSGGAPFLYGRKVLTASLRRLEQLVADEHPVWVEQQRRIRALTLVRQE